jgi:hypothetical protein
MNRAAPVRRAPGLTAAAWTTAPLRSRSSMYELPGHENRVALGEKETTLIKPAP